jgi:hypothetical protein
MAEDPKPLVAGETAADHHDRSVESYAHRMAKALLARWLREIAAETGYDNPACLGGIGWRVNRPSFPYGIWTEYPVLSDYTGITSVWDEELPRWARRPPTYDEVVSIGYRPMAIIDIAVQHKGRIEYAIEILHKHAVNRRKFHFLREHTTVIEVPTTWVLGQIARPVSIPEEFFCRDW